MSTTTPLPRVGEHGGLHDPDFWLRDLRLGRYHEIRRNIGDSGYRLHRVTTCFRTKRVLRYLASRLDTSADARVDEIQAALAERGEALLPYLLVAAFAAHKTPAAVVDAAEAVLPPEVLAACRDTRGTYDRLLLLLFLVDHQPSALAHVRGLHVWHRHGAASLVLADRTQRPRNPLAEMLTPEGVERAIAGVPRPMGVPPVRFEMAVPRNNGEALVFLRRNLRRAHNWSDDGTQIHHGHDEEIIVLHFLDGGLRVRVSAQTFELPRRLAEAIVSAWTGTTCHFVDDLAPAEPASLRRMVCALVSRQVPGLALVEVAVRNAPLAGGPDLVLRSGEDGKDVSESIAHFEQLVGPLLDHLDRIQHIKVAFGDRRVLVDFPVVGGQPIVRFADGRLDRHAAEAFRVFVEGRFGLPLHSMDARCA